MFYATEKHMFTETSRRQLKANLHCSTTTNLTLVFTVLQKTTINLWVQISTGKFNFIINKRNEAKVSRLKRRRTNFGMKERGQHYQLTFSETC